MRILRLLTFLIGLLTIAPLVSFAANLSCGPVYATENNPSFFKRIYVLSGTTATVFSGTAAPTQNAAAIAQATNTKIYFDNGSNTNIYSYDATATSLLSGSWASWTNSSGPGGGWNGNIYYVGANYHLYEVAPSGGITNLGLLSPGTSGDTVYNTLQVGDVASDANGRIYWYASVAGTGNSYLYRIDKTTLKATDLGKTGPNAASGLAFDSNGNLITTTVPTSTTNVYSINPSTLVATNLGTVTGLLSSGGTIYDLASCNLPLLNPNLGITKSVANVTTGANPATLASAGDTLEYTITVTNTGNLASDSTTISDTIPTGVTYLAGSTKLNGTTVADVSGKMPFDPTGTGTRLINTSGQPAGVIATGGSNAAIVKFRVTVNSSSLPTTISNTATVNFPTVSNGVTTFVNVTSSSADVPTPAPNVLGFKSVKLTADADSSGTITPGDTVTYTLQYVNTGAANSTGFQINDVLPSNLTVTATGAQTVTVNGSGTSASKNTSYTGAAAGAVSDLLASGATLAVGGVVTVTIPATVNSGATGTVNNQATATGTGISTGVLTDNAGVTGDLPATVTNAPYNLTIPTSSVSQTISAATDPTKFTIAQLPDLTIAKSHSGSFTAGSSGTYNITVSNSGGVSFGTITVTDTLPNGLTVNGGSAGAVTLGGTNAANWSCSSNAATPQVITCTSTTAIAASGNSVFNFAVNVGLGTAVGTNSVTNNATLAGGGDSVTNNNSATDPTTILAPDLNIAKSHTGNFTKGASGAYSLTVSNNGTAATSGTITVSDTLPTGLTVANGALTLGGANSANWTCNAASNVITCTSTTAIATSGSSVFSFSVNVSATAPNSLTNTATVSGGNEATVNNTNNSDDDPTTTVLPPTFGCSDKGYAIKNAGTIAEFWEIDIATGASTQLINPIIPASLGSQGANSIGYNPLDGLIYGKRIGTSEIIRIASDLSVQIIPITGLPTANLFAADVSANGIYYLTRTGYTTIERVDVNPSSPTYMTRLTPINVPAVNYSDIAINPNDGYAYAITDGAAPHSLLRIDLTTGSVTTIGTVTGGGSEAGTNFGSSWMDSNGNLFFNQGANGNTYKIASTHTLTTGAVTSTFVSTTTTGINDGAKCNTSAVVLGPNVSLAKSHTGNFTVGSSGTYSFTVSNIGETATSGTITVTDTLPIGLTVNGGGVGAITEGGTNAANWTCNSAALAGSPAQQTITCTSTTAIATSGTSVFSFNVNVGVGTAVGTNSITNTAAVAGGGEIDTTNNSTSDPTTVLSPDLTIVKSHSSDFTRGSTGVYNITVGNSGTVATSGTITVSDTLPAGLNIADGAMTLGGANSANWACNAVSNVITCTSSTVIAISGSSIFSFTVNVASNAAATVNNTATVSGGGEATANNGNNSSSDPTTIASNPPNVTLAKSCPSPANCTTAPQLPGTDITYKIEFANIGGLSASNLSIVDKVPNNMDYKLSSATANLGTTSLTFSIEFSSDYDSLNPTLATWTYTPVSGGGGASAGYDRNVKAVRWRVTSGTLSSVSPNNAGDIAFVSKIQ